MVRLGALRRKPHDAIYAVTLPFRDFSSLLRVECEERGLTGVREAVVLAEFLRVRSDDMEGCAACERSRFGTSQKMKNTTPNFRTIRSRACAARYVICIPLSSWPRSESRGALLKIETSTCLPRLDTLPSRFADAGGRTYAQAIEKCGRTRRAHE
jgi:hypothetical protein